MWTVTHARPGEKANVTQYAAHRFFPEITHPLALPLPWAHTTRPSTEPAYPACSHASIPFWDGVRYGLSVPGVSPRELRVAGLYTYCWWDSFSVGGEIRPIVRSGFASDIVPSVNFEPTTGFLTYARFYPAGCCPE